MKLGLLPILATAALCAAQAGAAVVFSDNFDGENGGATSLSYGSFANFTVIGDVDLIGTPNGYGITCFGGGGTCVDLNGARQGALTSRNGFAFQAGDVVTLTARLRGSQRGAAGGFALGLLGGGSNASIISVPDLAADADYMLYSTSFTATSAGNVFAQISSLRGGDAGPILDDVVLDITSSVPEPATWGLMILGFGIAGAALRRGRRTDGRAAAA